MKIKYISLLVFLLTLYLRCSKGTEIEFCFGTMVKGRVAVSATIGDVMVPCGYLSSTGGQGSNEGYDFNKNTRICGASASGYVMELPDSAFLDWSFRQEGHEDRDDLIKFYEKRFKLPDFPKKKWNERYRIYFKIAYQDCVYCRIDVVEK